MGAGARRRARTDRARRRIPLVLVAAASACAVVAAAVALTAVVASRPNDPVGAAGEPTHAAPPIPDAAVDSSALVTAGSPLARYPESRQGEPSLAIDPSAPAVAAAGANDMIDVAPCDRSARAECGGSPGVGVSGVYFSFDGGRTWRQPAYRGWSARSGTARRGRIGTLPRYREAGLASRGDPSLAFGPRPGDDGSFSWSNGSRLYYANLATRFPRADASFQGRTAIAVSRTDDPRTAAAGERRAWRRPVVVSGRLGRRAVNDKEAIWADRSASSPHFGNVYVCWTAFNGRRPLRASIVASRSTDGGATWSAPVPLTTTRNTVTSGGRQGCAVRTDSSGRVFVAWWDTPRVVSESIQVVARSTDGGRTFADPRTIAPVDDVGRRDPLARDRTLDGIGGSRTNSFPSLSIADGAPTGTGATDAVAVVWADARGRGRERAVLSRSLDGGRTWSPPRPISARADRASMPAVAFSPSGESIHLVYTAYLRGWRRRTGVPRPVRGVVRSAASSAAARWTTKFESAVQDARAATVSSLTAGGLYDYNAIAATGERVLALWNDVRRGAVCRAADRYRQARADGRTVPRPPRRACPGAFGNTDVYAFATSTDG